MIPVAAETTRMGMFSALDTISLILASPFLVPVIVPPNLCTSNFFEINMNSSGN